MQDHSAENAADPQVASAAAFDDAFCRFVLRRFHSAGSQLGQDLLALFAVGPGPGVFLDVGASDPVEISNTWLLEQVGWDGLLVEPNPDLHDAIRSARRAELVPAAASATEAGEATLRIVEDDPELSQLEAGLEPDELDMRGARARHRRITVPLVAIRDLVERTLARFGRLDYVNLDVEGLEGDLVRGFPFDLARPALLTVEHNHARSRGAVRERLVEAGYAELGAAFSRWDGWFVRADMVFPRQEPEGPSPDLPRSDRQAMRNEPLVNAQDFLNHAAARRWWAELAPLSSHRCARSADDPAAHLFHARAAMQLDRPAEARTALDAAHRAALRSGDGPFLRRHIQPFRASAEPRILASPAKLTPPATVENPADPLAALRRSLSEPHDRARNVDYVRRVLAAAQETRPRPLPPKPDDFEERIRLARIGARRMGQIPEAPHPRAPAGEAFERGGERVQRMHDGVLVPAGGYYGAWMTRLIETCAGRHEPQEEHVFDAVMRTVPARARMIELGAFWAYYSAAFLSARGDEAEALLVEPDPLNLGVGLETMRLNGLRAHARLGMVAGPRPLPPTRFGFDHEASPRPFSVADWMRLSGWDQLDVLHADVQGAETRLLADVASLLRARKITNVMISTHTPELHMTCLSRLSELGYFILCDYDLSESYSFDGFVCARSPDASPLPYMDVARRSLDDV